MTTGKLPMTSKAPVAKPNNEIIIVPHRVIVRIDTIGTSDVPNSWHIEVLNKH